MSTPFFSNHNFSIGDGVVSVSRLFFGVGEVRALMSFVLFLPQPELGIVAVSPAPILFLPC